MRRATRLPLLWRMCLCFLVGLACRLSDRAQQQATSSSQPAQTQDGAEVDNPRSSDKKISGLAVIVKIASVSGDSLFDADGYHVRVPTGAGTAFSGSLKTLADVVPGTWVHFVGTRDDTGVLVASKAEFFPPGTRTALKAMGPRKTMHAPDYQPVTHDVLLDANGRFMELRTKVRYSDSRGPCGWHRVPADPPLQDRVERIGMRLVPEFQKQLPSESPARIPFRFYAVADNKVRSVFACNPGLVLVPRNVVERLQNEDQLAAVLADAIAYHLVRQLLAFTSLDWVTAGADVSEIIPFLFPAGYIAGDIAMGIADYEKQARLIREVERVALQLMANANFDPWQAPEAWRLLAPKDPPKDIQSIGYTREGKYQLSILKLQYKPNNSELLGPHPASSAANPE